jgi:hypothetical protein
MRVSTGNLYMKSIEILILIFFMFSFSTPYSYQHFCSQGLSTPNLISPVNNTTWTQNLYPTFQWQTASGASSYTIQISKNSTDFIGGNLVKEATVYNTYYITDTALSNCTSYYWRVRGVDNSTYGSWSSVWKFTVQVAPSQPTLTSPYSGSVITIRRPTFSWEASSGATAYTIEIDGATYSVSTTSFTPLFDLSVGSHTWRVRATSCGGGQTSDWSPSRTFTINLDDVVLKQPSNGSIVTTQTPTFEWYEVEGATNYKLEVREDSITGQAVFQVEVSGTSFTPTAILSPGVYAWHVMSYRNRIWTGGWSSQPFTFTIQLAKALIAPTLQSPTSGSTVDFPLTLRWSSVSGAYSYTLEYSRDSSFPGPESVTLFGIDHTISSALEEGRWYWRVRANASQGGSGPWSSVWSFEVGLPVPQLVSPTNGTTQGASSVSFDWTDVTGSQIGGELYDLDHYVLQYSTSSTFESQNTISISESGGLPLRDSDYGPINLGDGVYYWRVRAIYIKYPDGTLREGSWSTSYSFTISTSSAKVALVSPPNGFENTPARPTFSWLQAHEATTYRLQVDNNSNFLSPVINKDNITTTSYMAPSELSPGNYYWRVNSNAPNAKWSNVWSFTISDPKQIMLISPSSGAQDMPPIPLFQWQSLEGATPYTLEVSANTSFTSLLVNKIGLTSTSWGKASDWESNSPSSLDDGIYYWRVSSNLKDSISAIWNFTVKKSSSGERNVTIIVNVSNVNADPISGATIILTKDGETAGAGLTDASGKSTISNLEKGTYTLEVTASGYKTYTETVNLSSNTTKDITLYRGAVIHGYVYYDNTQNPASNVAVRIYDVQTQLQVISGITDTNGYFLVDNAQKNRTYYIVIENHEDQKKQGIIPVDSPTTANAMTVIIKTEGEIIGVVQDEESAPLPGAKVTLRDHQGQFVSSASTNNMGSFTFKVTPGQYFVEVTLLGYEDYTGDIFTVEYKEVEDVGLITLASKTGTLVVTVQNEAGDPLDAIITVKDAIGNIINTTPVSRGKTSIEITMGIYTLEAETAGYQSQVMTNVSIDSGAVTPKTFILTRIAGYVKIYLNDPDGIPISDAEVFLDGKLAGATDQTGSATISNISPGNYTIYMIKEGFDNYTEVHIVNPGETLILEIIMERTSNTCYYILSIILAIGTGIAVLKIIMSRSSQANFCPYCGNRIEKTWSTCIYCGANLDKTRVYDDDTQIY